MPLERLDPASQHTATEIDGIEDGVDAGNYDFLAIYFQSRVLADEGGFHSLIADLDRVGSGVPVFPMRPGIDDHLA